MLGMSAAGAYLAFMKSQMNNVFGGILAFYLVATAWATARRRDGQTGIFDWVALLVILAAGAGIVTYGVEAASSQTGSKDGIPAGMYFFLGSVALVSAAGDVRMLVRGGVFGAQRIARHLWRMCFALFIAAGSLFLGQQQVFPAALRKTNVLFLASILPLILMIFWLFRVRFGNAYKRKSMPRGGDVSFLRT
jgi:amino acid permease